jgi:hypothetical protein
LERVVLAEEKAEQADQSKRRIGRFLKPQIFGRRWLIGGVRPPEQHSWCGSEIESSGEAEPMVSR